MTNKTNTKRAPWHIEGQDYWVYPLYDNAQFKAHKSKRDPAMRAFLAECAQAYEVIIKADDVTLQRFGNITHIKLRFPAEYKLNAAHIIVDITPDVRLLYINTSSMGGTTIDDEAFTRHFLEVPDCGQAKYSVYGAPLFCDNLWALPRLYTETQLCGGKDPPWTKLELLNLTYAKPGVFHHRPFVALKEGEQEKDLFPFFAQNPARWPKHVNTAKLRLTPREAPEPPLIVHMSDWENLITIRFGSDIFAEPALAPLRFKCIGRLLRKLSNPLILLEPEEWDAFLKTL